MLELVYGLFLESVRTMPATRLTAIAPLFVIGFRKHHKAVLPIEVLIGIPGSALIRFGVFLLHKKTLLWGQGLLNIN